MIKTLTKIADAGSIVCDSFEVRRLWYAGLVEWCSPTEVRLTSTGLVELYRAEEAEATIDRSIY